jgi:uncharacterized protein (UPF0276 family)
MGVAFRSLPFIKLPIDQVNSMMTQEHGLPIIGVGLRHPHYEAALESTAPVDFLEVHAENFFMPGGAALAVLKNIREHYALSIHGTALSLGSLTGLSEDHIGKFKYLVEHFDPILISDHACFSQSRMADGPLLHLGDLLPLSFNEVCLNALVQNIQQVQEALDKIIMIENLSAYLEMPENTMTESEFLVETCKKSGCKLLIDLNNLVVNATNAQVANIQHGVTEFLTQIPESLVGELHLAGCTTVAPGEIMVDDHSQPVPENVWAVYRNALMLYGPKPTLIEWDTALPSWQTLLAEAAKARAVADEVLSLTRSAC